MGTGCNQMRAFGHEGNTNLMNSGEALRRAGLNDEKGIFTSLPKGGGFPCLGKRHFSQGIGSDNQIGRCFTGQIAQIGIQRPSPCRAICLPWAARLLASFRNGNYCPET